MLRLLKTWASIVTFESQGQTAILMMGWQIFFLHCSHVYSHSIIAISPPESARVPKYMRAPWFSYRFGSIHKSALSDSPADARVAHCAWLYLSSLLSSCPIVFSPPPFKLT